MNLRKIISGEVAGESHQRLPAFTRPALRPYLPDGRLFRALCRACGHGSARIVVLTWRWCRAAPAGDRLLRAAAPAGMLAAAVYGVRVEGRPVLLGLAGAWLAAAAALAPRDTWQPPTDEPTDDEGDIPQVDPDTPAGRRLAFLRWLERETRDAPGIHLDQLHQRLTRIEPANGLPRQHLRPLLQYYGVPVQRTLRVGPVSGRSGVSRQAVLDALAAAETSPPLPVETGPVDGPVHIV